MDLSSIGISPDELPDPLRQAMFQDAGSSFQEATKGMPQFTGFAATGAPSVWDSMCQKMLADIHRNHSMTTDAKEAMLQRLQVPIAGEPAGREVVVLEDGAGVFSAGATGSVLWPAAVALIAKLDAELSGGAPPRVVELGAGLGAVGVFLAKHKGCPVVLTELLDAVPLLLRNVTENFSVNAPEVVPLAWGDRDQLRAVTLTGRYDLVVGSDISYRPEFLQELLLTAADLMEPTGRFYLSLQDRPGEAQQLEAAIASSSLQIAAHETVPMPKIGAEQAAIETDQRWVDNGGLPDIVHIYELVRRERRQLTSIEDVEAEFERITGIRPESVAPALEEQRRQLEQASQPVPPQTEAQPPTSMKEKLIQDFLAHGLGEKLFEVDEDLSAKLRALDAAEKPKTDTQRRQFAEAYYAGKEWHAPATNALLDSIPAWGDEPRLPGMSFHREEEEPDDWRAPANETTTEAPDARGSSSAASSCKATVCLDGLEWQMDASSDEKEMCLTVSFGEDLWERLRGMDASTSSFRDAVSFELAEREMRVMHVGTCVLHLHFPHSVDTAKAVAKISGRSRCVTVRASLT
mmetsp:Transcript_57775/g.137542  ORF Transcript_57775/g.137542 Transcript_57775/m.137542 type:complete len:576 (+) Transcript_57775:87-1814(+)